MVASQSIVQSQNTTHKKIIFQSIIVFEALNISVYSFSSYFSNCLKLLIKKEILYDCFVFLFEIKQ